MAYRRKRTTRKRVSRRRTVRRRVGLVKSPTFYFKRTVYQSLIITGNDISSFGYGALTFNLSQLPSFTEFTTLFDRFTIKGIKLTFAMQRTGPNTGQTTTGSGWNPNLIVVKDFDDSTTPGSINDLMQYPSVKTMRFNDTKQVYTMYFKPARQQVEYVSAVSSGYRPTWSGMIATAGLGSAEPFYGIKYAYEKMFTGTQLDVMTTYYLAFKDPK